MPEETNESIGILFQNISSLLSRLSDQALNESLNISYSQYKILSALDINQDLRQIDIAHILGQTEASISRQVKIMTKNGLIKITLNKDNKREHLIHLTGKGSTSYAKATRILNDLYYPIFRNLKVAQIINFKGYLKTIQTSIN
jgi:DNA-binding MarR family transcriptional regulator